MDLIYGAFLTYNHAMHTVVESPSFLRDAKSAHLSSEEIAHIVTTIADNPQMGDDIQGTGGARKVRFGGHGKGKSGGYRVITFYSGDDIPVFLLNIFAKNEQSDLSQEERNELKSLLAHLASVYRRRKR